MKHHITLVGGQILPVYIGIKEFKPDVVHFIVSKESIDKITSLNSFLVGMSFTKNVCNPYDFFSIREICKGVLKGLSADDEVQINITGGTKIMLMAVESLIIEMKLKGFYINQDNTLLLIPNYSLIPINYEIKIEEFIKLSGHQLSRSKDISDYSKDDFNVVDSIDEFSTKYPALILKINSKIRKAYPRLHDIPSSGQIQIDNTYNIGWDTNNIVIASIKKRIFNVTSQNVRSLFFYAAWWELLVAREVFHWSKVQELLIQCEMPFKMARGVSKNEIDILVNVGGRLIFIECKSGKVKQEDINKMKIVKDTYGGIVSKSLLVCRFKPDTTIFEKCQELDIGVFWTFDRKAEIHPLRDLLITLDNVGNRPSI